jgi:hypothetical protein
MLLLQVPQEATNSLSDLLLNMSRPMQPLLLIFPTL